MARASLPSSQRSVRRPRRRAPDESRKPAANASPAPVVSTTSTSSDGSSVSPSAPRTTLPFAPRLTTTVGAVSDPEQIGLGLVGEDHLGIHRFQRRPERLDAGFLDGGGGAEVDADPNATRRGGQRRFAKRRVDQAVPGDVQPLAAVQPGRVQLLGGERGRDPRSLNIVLAPFGVATETTVPVPDSTSGPARSTPRAASSSASRRPAGSRARLPRNRARPPSATTQAATLAA